LELELTFKKGGAKKIKKISSQKNVPRLINKPLFLMNE